MSLLPRICRADRVVIAGGPHTFPSRTRPLRPRAPMVLHLKVWESRSLPGLHDRSNRKSLHSVQIQKRPRDTHGGVLASGPRNDNRQSAAQDQDMLAAGRQRNSCHNSKAERLPRLAHVAGREIKVRPNHGRPIVRPPGTTRSSSGLPRIGPCFDLPRSWSAGSLPIEGIRDRKGLP